MKTKTPEFWQHGGGLSVLLLPVSWIYAALSRLHRCWQAWRLPPQKLAAPIICIGNLTAGGAGKTPAAMMVANLLMQAGKQPHFISRGYGGAVQHQPRQVLPQSDARELGDEPLILAQTAPCWVCRDRNAAAKAAIAAGAELILADDGLQNPSFYKDVSLIVIDGGYGLGNGCVLPAGPLRESASAGFAKADAVIVIDRQRGLVLPAYDAPIWEANLQPLIDMVPLKATPIYAFAGIGRPQKFFDFLTARGMNLVGVQSLADHQSYDPALEGRLAQAAQKLDATLVTTQKDYVKLSPAFQAKVTVIEVVLTLKEADNFTQWLTQKLHSSTV